MDEVIMIRHLLFMLGVFVCLFLGIQFRDFFYRITSQEEFKFCDYLMLKLILSAVGAVVIFIISLLR